MNIGIFIYNKAEVLDFSGPFEVFSTAKRLAAKDWNVFLVSESGEAVVARGGFTVVPQCSLQNHPPVDVLVVAGGVHTDVMNNDNVLHWIQTIDTTADVVASVCTGAFLLANAGLLDGRPVTTHWEDIPELKTNFPKLQVLTDRRWVVSDKYITSGGISAGIDMSLHLVATLHSQELAEKVAHQMEYRWEG